MAIWTNLFDIGPCIVRVRLYDKEIDQESILFEQQMLKNGYQEFAWPGHESGLMLGVSSNGGVSLESFYENMPSTRERLSLEVELVTPASKEGSRLRDVLVLEPATNTYAYTGSNVEEVPLNQISGVPGAPQTVDPDPVVLGASSVRLGLTATQNAV